MPSDKQRRETERRRLQRQVERRRQQAVRRRNGAIIMSVIGAVLIVGLVVGLVVGLGGNSSSGNDAAASRTPSASPTASSTTAATYPCTWDAPAAPQQAGKRTVHKPTTTTPPRTGTVKVDLTTTQGPMTFTLDRAAAPCTVASFLSLVQQKYFDDTPCHRLTGAAAGIYVLQCGDPTGTGRGGPQYTIPDEGKPTSTYTAATIAMARSSLPHSGASQFFIVYKDSPYLSQGSTDQSTGAVNYYTVFGKVSSGESVVDKVAGAGVAGGGADGKPKTPITFRTVTTAG